MTELWKTITRQHRNRLAERAAAGDEDAAAELAGFDRLGVLGPIADDAASLLRIEESVLDRNGRRSLSPGGAIPWIESREALEARVFSLMMGDAFDDLEDASLGARLNGLSRMTGLPEIPWPRDEPWPNDIFARAQQRSHLVDQFDQADWLRAFSEGRILTFMTLDGVWRLRPPSHWRDAAPFAPTRIMRFLKQIERALEQIETETPRDATGLAGRSPEARAHEDRMTAAFGPQPPIAALARSEYSQEHLNHISEASSPRGLFGPAGQDPEATFLIIRDLPQASLAAPPTTFHGVGPRSKRARQLKDALKQWFADKVAQGERWSSKAAALKAIEQEASDRTGATEGWKNMANEVWREVAPEDWKKPGRKPTAGS